MHAAARRDASLSLSSDSGWGTMGRLLGLGTYKPPAKLAGQPHASQQHIVAYKEAVRGLLL